MADHSEVEATVEVPSHAGAGEHAAPGLLDINTKLMGLTWVTFAIMAFILYRVAWKPILNALDQREKDIQKAIEDATKTREELARIDEKRQAVLAEADAKAKDIVDTARRAAVDAAQTIESKAREEAQILIQNAEREIGAAQGRAVAALRKESADLAISLAKRVIGANLDEARSRAVTDELIRKL